MSVVWPWLEIVFSVIPPWFGTVCMVVQSWVFISFGRAPWGLFDTRDQTGADDFSTCSRLLQQAASVLQVKISGNARIVLQGKVCLVKFARHSLENVIFFRCWNDDVIIQLEPRVVCKPKYMSTRLEKKAFQGTVYIQWSYSIQNQTRADDLPRLVQQAAIKVVSVSKGSSTVFQSECVCAYL
jgi:hypothetical protein